MTREDKPIELLNRETMAEDATLCDRIVRGHKKEIARALEVLRVSKRPTICSLQRRLGIGYNKATSLLNELERLGYVGPQPSSGMREILWENFPPSRSCPGTRRPQLTAVR